MGQIAPHPDGGLGGAAPGYLTSPGDDHRAIGRNVRLARKAVKQRWPIPPEAKKEMVDLAIYWAKGADNGRDFARAASILTTMSRDNLDAIVQLDRMERLEAGQTTENIGITAATQPVIETAKRISARAGVNAPAE